MLYPSPPVILRVSGSETQPAWKYLLTRDYICSPIKRVTAIVYRAARFWGFMYGAEKLPFAGAHFRAGCRRTWWSVEEETNDQIIAFIDQKTAELVKPQSSINVFRRCRNNRGSRSCDWNCMSTIRRFGMVVMESFKMLL